MSILLEILGLGGEIVTSEEDKRNLENSTEVEGERLLGEDGRNNVRLSLEDGRGDESVVHGGWKRKNRANLGSRNDEFDVHMRKRKKKVMPYKRA